MMMTKYIGISASSLWLHHSRSFCCNYLLAASTRTGWVQSRRGHGVSSSAQFGSAIPRSAGSCRRSSPSTFINITSTARSCRPLHATVARFPLLHPIHRLHPLPPDIQSSSVFSQRHVWQIFPLCILLQQFCMTGTDIDINHFLLSSPHWFTLPVYTDQRSTSRKESFYPNRVRQRVSSHREKLWDLCVDSWTDEH